MEPIESPLPGVPGSRCLAIDLFRRKRIPWQGVLSCDVLLFRTGKLAWLPEFKTARPLVRKPLAKPGKASGTRFSTVFAPFSSRLLTVFHGFSPFLRFSENGGTINHVLMAACYIGVTHIAALAYGARL